MYYILKKDGTRIEDEFGDYYPAVSRDEARDYEACGYEIMEAERFNKIQGY